MQIDSIIPSGGDVRWTIIDDDMNESIPHLTNKSGDIIPLGSIDWNNHESLRLSIELSAGINNQMPTIRGIYADGSSIDALENNPTNDGWTGNFTWGQALMSSHYDNSMKGGQFDEAISPWYNLKMPLNSLDLTVEGVDANVHYRTSESSNWVDSNVSFSNGIAQLTLSQDA